MFNPFLTNVPLLYPLKTSENLRFCDDFRGYRGGTLVENGLTRSFKDPSANKYMLKFKFVQIKKQTNTRANLVVVPQFFVTLIKYTLLAEIVVGRKSRKVANSISLKSGI